MSFDRSGSRANPFAAVGRFVRQCVDELRKVVTPTARAWAGWCLAGFVFVILLMLMVTGMDFGLGKAVLTLFGGASLAAPVWLSVTLKALVGLTSVLLGLLILLHRGKGGGISDMFGGGLMANAGTSGVAEKNLNRWTVAVALVWVAAIVALDFLA